MNNFSNSLINLQILRKVCEELSIPYEVKDDFGNFVEVKKDGKSFFFVHCNTPFNNDGSKFVAKDKEFSYTIFGKSLHMPQTKGYLDPNVDEKYSIFTKHKSHKEIIEDIESNFKYPMIIKMNAGSQGRNTFLCKKTRDVKRALKNIFNKKNKNYDYIANVQEFINIQKEYRAIWFMGQIVFVYEKVCEVKRENISPLHNDGAKAVLVEDEKVFSEIKSFLSQTEHLKDFEYLGLDIVIDENNQIRLLEINSHPGFSYFIRDSGEDEIVGLYRKMLENLK
ncbi:alpha-L-glutamate ligase [Candidatus Nomurabacteria bacterium]|nr:alpha-L-glutamate ligase [Candidatus Nomurabacteria bacterium]